MCFLVQVETRRGYENLEAIVAVDGVNGVFFGSADLAASCCYLGQSTRPEIVAAIQAGLKKVSAAASNLRNTCRADPAGHRIASSY